MAATIVDLIKKGVIPAGPASRQIPRRSGEGAIYSPEYLARREGNANGADPHRWWKYVFQGH